MKIQIKNMVCQGTRSHVLLELERLSINYNSFEHGEINIEKDLSFSEMRELDDALSKYGLEKY